MTREELKQWVEARIDEVLPRNDAGNVEVLIESPANIIDQELNPSAVFLLRNAPREVLFNMTKSVTDSTITEDDDGSGIIGLPSDFLRFVSLKLDDWKRPLTELISQDDPRYRLQFNQYLKGTKIKPVGVLIDDDGASKQAIQYFSSDEHTLDKFSYIPRVAAEEMHEDLIDPLVWYCASRVLMIMKRVEEANASMAMAEKLLNEIKYGIIGE